MKSMFRYGTTLALAWFVCVFQFGALNAQTFYGSIVGTATDASGASVPGADVRTAGIANYDFSLFKAIAVRERLNIQFRTEFFNIFNRVQFGPPGEVQGNTQFGIVSTQLNTPRLVQFALRMNY
jgi:hypothetical protein